MCMVDGDPQKGSEIEIAIKKYMKNAFDGHRHYDVSSNNAHEGTNYGFKSHSAAVRPCQKLDSTGKALTLQGVLKVNDIEHEALRGFTVKSL
eukprot:8405469-Ditylum_brightwellii.AAC.1